MSDHLPAPWTSRPCEHCGADHPPAEDCLPRVSELAAFEEEPARSIEDLDLLEGLIAVFGEPEEFAPGILLFKKGPRQ